MPAGVFELPLDDDPPPPQAVAATATISSPPTMRPATANRVRCPGRERLPALIAIKLALRIDKIAASQKAKGSAGPDGGAGRVRSPGALADPVVEMVKVEVLAVEPLGVTEAGEKWHAAPVGRVPHVSDTATLNPPCGVTLIV